MSEKKNVKKAHVPAAMFVQTWQSATSLMEVASSLGIGTTSAYQRARAYRSKGIELKKFASTRGGTRLDVVSLNSLAQKSVKA